MGLLVALVLLLAVAGLAGAIVPLVVSEIEASANHRRAMQMLYAAEAAAEHALHELRGIRDWSEVLDGRRASRFRSANLQPRLADGTTVDLTRVSGMLPATEAVWLPDTTRSPPPVFLHGRFDRLVRRSAPSVLYVVVWVRDGPVDDDPEVSTAFNNALVLYAACLGPGLAQRVVRVVARRREAGWVEAVSWRVVR